jgi:hypothetical protein
MRNIILLTFSTFLLFSCSRSSNNKELWPEISRDARPWTRWWWMGNAVDENNITRLMKEYHDAGFGGVEITPIYGAVGFENQYIKYLSPQWLKMLDIAVGKAGKNDMGVDMNLGTGWPFGGPQIKVPAAASKLIVKTWEIKAGKPFRDKVILEDLRQIRAGAELQLLIASNRNGKAFDITAAVDSAGKLSWTPDTGKWKLTAAFCGKTLQQVKRAAPGGEGLVMDHFSKDALLTYLSRFDQTLGESNHGVRCFFNDSYEVYGTNWTPQFLAAFEKLRGYPLQIHINELVSPDDSSETAHRIRYDYRQTISDLVLENFTKPWTSWTNQKKSLTRNQAHGSPGNLLDLYANVDIPECETFGSSYFPIPGLRRDSADIRNVDPDPVMMKFASSAAHVTGKKLSSCETFTWLAEHFKVSLSQCKPEVEQVFLAGTNHVFYHGTTYSPASAGWPGWLFYASVNFAPSNSFWPHIQGLNNYITRCQSLLQSGLPDNDLLVYWPLPDYWMNPTDSNLQLSIHNIDRWLHPTPFYKAVRNLQSEGYGLDFISDRLLDILKIENNQLKTPSGASYKALIFPASRYIPETTLQKAISLAEQGALVIFQQLPDDVPGFGNYIQRRNDLSEMIASLNLVPGTGASFYAKKGSGEILVSAQIIPLLSQKGISPEELVKTGLQYIRRNLGDGVCYFLVNHTSQTVDDFIPIKKFHKNQYLLNPLNDITGVATSTEEELQTKIRIRLRPGESLFILSTDRYYPADNWDYADKSLNPTELNGPWKLAFLEGGPVLPSPVELTSLQSWTSLYDENCTDFSGTALYSTVYLLPEKSARDYILSLNSVHESAKIRINDQDAGICWSIPYDCHIGKWLNPGENKIEIEVANLMANRIRWMDRQKKEWRRYHEINFVNINYKSFNAAKWEPMPSGLEGPVTITPLQ